MELNKVYKISSRVKWYTFFKFFLLIFLAVLPFYFTGEGLNKLIVTLFLLVIFLLAWLFIWFTYSFLSFTVAKNKITFNYGIINKHSKIITFDKVQSIDITKGILQRVFDVCRLNIWIASPEQIKTQVQGVTSAPAMSLELSFYHGEWLKEFILSENLKA